MMWILVSVLMATTTLSLVYSFAQKDRAEEAEEEREEMQQRTLRALEYARKRRNELVTENAALTQHNQRLQAALDKLAAEAREDAK